MVDREFLEAAADAVGIEAAIARELQSTVGEAVYQARVFDLILNLRVAPRNGADVSPPPINIIFLVVLMSGFSEALQCRPYLALMVGLLNGPLWDEAIKVGRPRGEPTYEDLDDGFAESQEAIRAVAPFPFEEAGCLAGALLFLYCFHSLNYQVLRGIYKRRGHTR
jgi:hypothetical protein